MRVSTALYSVADIRGIELAAQADLPPGTLMQRAGDAACAFALKLLKDAGNGAPVLVLAGPGNNGGDAFEAAHRLAQNGIRVSILSFADPARQPPDARQALSRAQGGNAHFADPARWSEIMSAQWSLVIDGLFGIGLARPISGMLRTLVAAVNALPCPILALDVPSGLDADTGDLIGEDGIAVAASHTITFIGNKPGLHTCYGRDYAGEVHVDVLGIDASCFMQPEAQLNRVQLFAHALHPRANNSHKGSFGDVTVIGGAHGMAGAAILAARTAAKCGAGRVFAAFIDDAPAYDGMQPELMCRIAQTHDFSSHTLVVGPGLGMSRTAHDLLVRALNTPAPLVLDADALNLVAAEPELQKKLAQRKAAHVMTPHPLEAARMLGTTSAAIQSDRLAAARELARRYNGTAVLKGSGSVIARPDGKLAINPTGNPGLATAGTGDVLAGICGALLAQGWPERDAALAAPWLHGYAADMLVAQGIGPTGMTASELIPAVRASLNRLIREHATRPASSSRQTSDLIPVDRPQS